MPLLTWLLSVVVRLWAWTWRVDQPAWPVQGPAVVAFWHGEQLTMIVRHRGLGIVPMASQSKDGEWVAQVLQHLGYRVIRGSTSRGGMAAYRAARKAIQEGESPALAVDGPRGPCGHIQPGVEGLARGTGAPLVFGKVEARGFRLGSWDHFLIPYPFAKVRIRYWVWHRDQGAFAPPEDFSPV